MATTLKIKIIYETQQVLPIKTSAYSAKQWCIDLLSITLLFGLFYAIMIGSHALFTPDEGRYSEVAREMIATGDFITPRLNGVVFLDKPILYYWLQASAIKLFGIKEWSLRFWPACLGILGCVITYICGHILFNRRAGLLSALLLATCPLYYGAAHYANLDLEVAIFVSGSLLFFITGMHVSGSKQRTAFLIAAYVFAGLAALTKGLIGIVFPGMIIAAWILLLNRWNVLLKMRLITGLFIFAAITLPWYILAQKANPQFLEFFFIKQQFSRFLTKDYFNNRAVFWFYAPIVLAGIFPWSVFFIQAIAKNVNDVWQNRQKHATELFLLLWFFLIFLFFSIPKSKTIGYILPVIPAFALLAGNYLSARWEQPRSKGILFGSIIFTLISFGIAAACFMVPHYNFQDISAQLIPYLTITGTIFTIAGIISGGLFLKKSVPQLVTAMTVTACAFLLMLSASSSVLNHKTIKPLAQQIKPLLQPDDEIVTYYKYYQDLPIYLERRITIVADWDANDIGHNDNWTRELWYGISFQDTKDWLINEKTFCKRWNSKKRLYVLTSDDHYDELRKKSKKHNVYKISQFHDTVLLTNLAENPAATDRKSNNRENG